MPAAAWQKIRTKTINKSNKNSLNKERKRGRYNLIILEKKSKQSLQRI